MTGRTIRAVIYGAPVPQGSTRAFVNQKGQARITSASTNLRPWRNSIAWEVRAAMAGPPMTGPVAVEAVFTVRKPASAPKRRRTWPTARPDVDKLLRAVLDGITDAGAWRDDSQVVHVVGIKTYPGEGTGSLEAPGAVLTITELEDTPWSPPK